MLLKQVTGPQAQVVSLTDVKATPPAPISHSDDDLQIEFMIDAASRMIGEMSGRVLVPETWSVSFAFGEFSTVRLPKSPVTALDSITYYDSDDVEQTASLSDFYFIADDDRALVKPKESATWPSANPHREDAITITFEAGYTTCPDPLKHAVTLTAKHFYDSGFAISSDRMYEVPLGVQALIGVERLGWAAS